VFAPVGVITKELPAQIEALFTAMVGVAFTETVDTTLFDTQPLAVEPASV
jgi:hypothetical protein